MTTTQTLDVKVVYSASSLGRRRPGTVHVGGPKIAKLIVLLGLINLAVAGSLYYATWWKADPKLRIIVLMRTPVPGVDLDMVAGALVPTNPDASLGQTKPTRSAARVARHDIESATADALRFVGTIVVWELLATLAAGGLALSGGTMLGRASDPGGRRAGIIVGLLLVVGVAVWTYLLWVKYGRFVPDQLRLGVGAFVLLSALTGLVLKRGVKRLAYVAAMLLILSAVGTVVALFVASGYDAIRPDDLPMPFLPLVAVAFVLHSAWGWILFPMASRLRH